MMLISFVIMYLMLFNLLVNYVNQLPHVILISLITVVLVHRPFIITSRTGRNGEYGYVELVSCSSYVCCN
jgi:hypothetical protein